jgi:ABC-type glycerol-3-phosphate transport system permease component
MPAEVTSNIYANYGVLGLIVIAFFLLVFWVLKTSSKREDKLYTLIETLSAELPEIRKAIEDINRKMR